MNSILASKLLSTVVMLVIFGLVQPSLAQEGRGLMVPQPSAMQIQAQCNQVYLDLLDKKILYLPYTEQIVTEDGSIKSLKITSRGDIISFCAEKAKIEMPETTAQKRKNEEAKEFRTERVGMCKDANTKVIENFERCNEGCRQNVKACYNLGSRDSGNVFKTIASIYGSTKGVSLPLNQAGAPNCKLTPASYKTERKEIMDKIEKQTEKFQKTNEKIAEAEEKYAKGISTLQETEATLQQEKDDKRASRTEELRKLDESITRNRVNLADAIRKATTEKSNTAREMNRQTDQFKIQMSMYTPERIKADCSSKLIQYRQTTYKTSYTTGGLGSGAAVGGAKKEDLTSFYQSCLKTGQATRDAAWSKYQDDINSLSERVKYLEASISDNEAILTTQGKNLELAYAEQQGKLSADEAYFQKKNQTLLKNYNDLFNNKKSTTNNLKMEQMTAGSQMYMEQNRLTALGGEPKEASAQDRTIQQDYTAYMQAMDSAVSLVENGCCPKLAIKPDSTGEGKEIILNPTPSRTPSVAYNGCNVVSNLSAFAERQEEINTMGGKR